MAAALRLLFIAFFSTLIASCGDDDLVQHTVELSNSGSEPVYDFQVSYGDQYFPTAPKETFSKGNQENYPVSMVLPETANVRWRTRDGNTHSYPVIIENKVVNKDLTADDFKIQFSVTGRLLEMNILRKNAQGQYAGRLVFSSEALSR